MAAFSRCKVRRINPKASLTLALVWKSVLLIMEIVDDIKKHTIIWVTKEDKLAIIIDDICDLNFNHHYICYDGEKLFMMSGKGIDKDRIYLNSFKHEYIIQENVSIPELDEVLKKELEDCYGKE